MYTDRGTLDAESLINKLRPAVRRAASQLMARLPPSVDVDDLVQAGIGICAVDDIAVSVLATVIGHQRRGQQNRCAAGTADRPTRPPHRHTTLSTRVGTQSASRNWVARTPPG